MRRQPDTRVPDDAIVDAWAGVTDLFPFPAQDRVNADVFADGEATHDPHLLPLWGGRAIGRVDDVRGPPTWSPRP